MGYSDELRGLEELLLDPTVRKNQAEVEMLLAEEYSEIGASGREYDRKAVIEALLSEPPAEIKLYDFCTRLLAEDVVLVTYRTVKRTSNVVAEARRSSIWVRHGERWRMYFHQGTKIDDTRE